VHTESSDDLGADADLLEGKTKSGSSEVMDQRALDANEADKKLSGSEEETLAAADRPGHPEPTLDSAAVQEACEAARQAGLAQGREEGLAQGREQALEEARQAHEATLEQAAADKAQALDQLRQELEGEIDPLKRQLNKAVEQVQSLVGQPDQLYEHIKRLSLHLAEQLVLGELNLSSAAIERLIQRCLDELDLHGNHVVTVELNPQDKARLQERAGEMSQALSVQAVSSLQPGSVRVMINDTLVEDLVGHRLDALAPASWYSPRCGAISRRFSDSPWHNVIQRFRTLPHAWWHRATPSPRLQSRILWTCPLLHLPVISTAINRMMNQPTLSASH